MDRGLQKGSGGTVKEVKITQGGTAKEDLYAYMVLYKRPCEIWAHFYQDFESMVSTVKLFFKEE